MSIDDVNKPKEYNGPQQFLVVSVIEVDDPELNNSASISAFVERVLMLNSNGLIKRCQIISKTGARVMAWGESGPEKIFKLVPIIEAENKNGDGI